MRFQVVLTHSFCTGKVILIDSSWRKQSLRSFHGIERREIRSSRDSYTCRARAMASSGDLQSAQVFSRIPLGEESARRTLHRKKNSLWKQKRSGFSDWKCRCMRQNATPHTPHTFTYQPQYVNPVPVLRQSESEDLRRKKIHNLTVKTRHITPA